VLAAECHGANMIPVWQNHSKDCVQIQISNRFCGHDDVVRYLIALLIGEHGPQQITNNFSI
jgi:hypothetical protein